MNTSSNDLQAIRERLVTVFDAKAARRLVPEQPKLVSASQPEPDAEARQLGDLRLAVQMPEVSETAAAKAGMSRVLGHVWEFTRSHLAAVGLVLLAGCLWAGYSISQAQSSEIPISQASNSAQGSQPTVLAVPSEPPSTSPAIPPDLVIHVIGGVKSPGVETVKPGSRVSDVLKAAGGLSSDGDPGELNLAAPAADGSQVIVGTKAKPKGEVRLAEAAGSADSGTAGAGGTQKVSLNTATAAQLEAVPGIGPVTAQRIVAWRQAHQRFSALEELQEVEGIGPKTYSSLIRYLRL